DEIKQVLGSAELRGVQEDEAESNQTK
ncbi:MAG: hypothetical protein QOF16_1857, partial [Actinomycetota bacterium]|nr:hypothetical protein [Actinomycetota bacterium]